MKFLKVILQKDIHGTGRAGDVIDVKPGFFMNCLSPQGKAVVATKAMIEKAKKIKEERMVSLSEVKEKVKKYMEKLSSVPLVFKRKVSEGEHLYGSLTEGDIIDEIKKQAKIEIEKKHVKMEKHIKELGKHWITIHFDDKNEVKMEIEVLAE